MHLLLWQSRGWQALLLHQSMWAQLEGEQSSLRREGECKAPKECFSCFLHTCMSIFWGSSSLSQEDGGLQESWGGILYQGL